MNTAQVQTIARQLFEEQGAKAIAFAAQKALSLERHHDSDQSQTWRRIEAALMRMRGPRET
jgi:hypothetical protein